MSSWACRARSIAWVATALFFGASMACQSSGSTLGATRPVTLREMYGATPPTSIRASTTALVLVDFQEEFFHGGLPVEGGQAAVDHAKRLVDWARATGVMVVHVQNIVTRPGSPIFAQGSPTTEIVTALTPKPSERELVMTKSMAGAFSKSDLDTMLRSRRIDTVVVAGIMTHLAVDTTVRDAGVLGYSVIVAEDACATRALWSPTDGTVIAASDLHRVALASMSDRFAEIMTTQRIVTLPTIR